MPSDNGRSVASHVGIDPSQSNSSSPRSRSTREGTSKEPPATNRSQARQSRNSGLIGTAKKTQEGSASSNSSRGSSVQAKGSSSSVAMDSAKSDASLSITKILEDDYYKAVEEKLKHEEIMNRKHNPKVSPNQLPWSDDEYESLKDQVTFWKNCLVEDDDRVPRDEVRDLLKNLYTILRQGNMVRSDRALEEVSKKLESIQRLDLHKLVDLMNQHEEAGKQMEGKDVILLLGSVGSGKTTTLHFLAGTKFIEMEVDGFIHLYPREIKEGYLKEFTTACGRDAVTRGLQVASVTYKDKNRTNNSVVICDTPGFELQPTSEEKLAYHYGMGAAIDKARRVKPVLVLNQELMGSCFSNLPATLQLMMKDLSLKTPRDVKTLEFVFTHYEERHRTRLCQQFATLKHHTHPRPETGGKVDLFDDLVNHIIAETTPKAKLAMPLSDDPEELLEGIWKESFVEEPRDYYYRTPAAEPELKILQLQLQITLEELRMALCREVYSLALNRMVLLTKLSVWFPQAKQAALLGKEAASRQVKMISDWMAKEVATGSYERALFRMEQMSDFGLIFPDAHECFKHGHDLIWESLVSPMEDGDYPLTMDRIAKLSTLAPMYTEANSCVKRALRLLRKKAENVIEMGGFKEALSLLVPLSSLSPVDTPEAGECASSILGSLSELMASTISRKDYTMALHMIRKFNSLQSLYPKAGEIANRGLSLCRTTLEASVDAGDYDSALFLVQHMQRLQMEFPQAEEIAQFGLRVFSRTIEVLIEHKDYGKAITLMRRVGLEVPGSNDMSDNGVGVFRHAVDAPVQLDSENVTVIGLMKIVDATGDSDKGIGLDEGKGGNVCTERALTAFGNEIKQLIESKDYTTAIFLMAQVGKEVDGSGDCILYCLRVFCNELEVLIDNKNYKEAVTLMKRLATDISETGEYILKGLSMLKSGLREAISQGDYESALSLIDEVNGLAKIVPQADACLEYAFNVLEEHILISIERQEYKSAIHLMELLSTGDNQLPLAKDCTNVGIQVLKRNVTQAIEKKKYSPAVDMIQQLGDKGQRIPEVSECSRRGLQLLKVTAEQAIQDKDYSTAIEIITNLSELSHTLPEAKSCTLSGLHAIVDHVTELRHSVEKTVEEIEQIRDLKVFVAMLLKLRSQIEKVMKSEPLRKLSVQIHYKKNFHPGEEESGESVESGVSDVLFVPQLYTSQAFCTDHVELVAGHIREKLPEFSISEACMESLIRNRKVILSVMIRLKAAHKILQDCPGGEKASSIYTSTFEHFHALNDTILAIAEESFKPPIDLRLFELQAWFLAVLIKGFIKDRIDIGSEERTKMEELESRRKVLMLQFEVLVTDAVELLSLEDNPLFHPPKAIHADSASETTDLVVVGHNDGSLSTWSEQETNHSSNHSSLSAIVISDTIGQLDLSIFNNARNLLTLLCQRSELMKMATKQYTMEHVKDKIETFDKSVVAYVGRMIRYAESAYNSLLEHAKSGESLPVILAKINKLKVEVELIEKHLGVARKWENLIVKDTQLHQQKILILKKRIELATEKLEATIQANRDIGFGAFMSNITSPFACNGNTSRKWYEDLPTSFL